jgi:hypothetical protein
MIIGARQEVLFAFLDPFFLFVSLALRAMPVTAGVIADGKISATVARINMTTQGRSPAVGQCPQCLFLMNAEVLG